MGFDIGARVPLVVLWLIIGDGIFYLPNHPAGSNLKFPLCNLLRVESIFFPEKEFHLSLLLSVRFINLI